MGHMVSAAAKEDATVKIIAGVDTFISDGDYDYATYSNVSEHGLIPDVAVDFSSADGVCERIEWARSNKVPLVMCVTGLSLEAEAALEYASHDIPVLRSANMSLGINLITALIKSATAALVPAGFDIEIVEKHHRNKKDAPSGTAIALAHAATDTIKGMNGKEYKCVHDRSGRSEKRPDAEIGISAVRGGTIVGEHTVLFAGTDEEIEITHRANSRAIFAKGAIAAAKFLAGKAAGKYSMADVIDRGDL
jgi:4-hydroxy-tetrahydrodipicolinate reductase